MHLLYFMLMSDYSSLLPLLLRAGNIAQNEILKVWQKSFEVEWKADSTPVTIADKKAEEAVRNFTEKETPEFGFIGEEFGIGGFKNTNASTENAIRKNKDYYEWVIDPIDGTKSFICGVPLFGSLIAILKNGKTVAGLIQLPALNSKIWAIKGGGAFIGCNSENEKGGKRVSASKIKNLSDALVLSGTINTMESKGYGKWFEGIRKNAKLYRGWGDCYGYYLVACGKAEIMADPVVSIWDIAPYPVIFSESGGHFSTLSGETSLFSASGEPLHSIYEGYTAIATNGKIEVGLP